MKISGEWSYKVQGTHSRLYDLHKDEGYGSWATCVVDTKYGIVEAYTQRDHTGLTFIYGGRMYSRSFQAKKIASQRSISILAGRFASEIARATTQKDHP